MPAEALSRERLSRSRPTRWPGIPAFLKVACEDEIGRGTTRRFRRSARWPGLSREAATELRDSIRSEHDTFRVGRGSDARLGIQTSTTKRGSNASLGASGGHPRGLHNTRVPFTTASIDSCVCPWIQSDTGGRTRRFGANISGARRAGDPFHPRSRRKPGPIFLANSMWPDRSRLSPGNADSMREETPDGGTDRFGNPREMPQGGRRQGCLLHHGRADAAGRNLRHRGRHPDDRRPPRAGGGVCGAGL